MALCLTVLAPLGVEIVNAYHRVEGVSFPTKNMMTFRIRSYANPVGFPHFIDAEHSIVFDSVAGLNPYVAAYNYLSALPEFTGAQNC